MAELRPHYIDVDLKKNTQYNVPVVTQNDTATHFIVRVTDDGLSDPELLDAYQEITMTSQRPDGESFYLTGTRIPGTNEIEFHLGTDETAFSGSVLASLQFYLMEDASRYTSAQFRYDVKKDLTTNYTPTQREETLVEVVLRDGPGVIQEAKDAKVAVDGALVELEQDKTDAIERLDEVTEENKTVFRQPVNTFADLATSYPNPEHGTTVRVTGESAAYRYSDGSWVKTDEYNPTAIDQVTAQLADIAHTNVSGFTGNDAEKLNSFLQAHAGKTVRVPRGAYNISSSVIVPEGTEVIAYGVKLNCQSHIVGMTLNSNTIVRGIEINGFGYLTPADAGRGIEVRGSTAAVPKTSVGLYDCKIKNIGYHGILLEFAHNINIYNCDIENLGYSGIMGISVKDVIVEGKTKVRNVIGNVNAYGMAFTRHSTSTDLVLHPRSEDCVVRDCLIENVEIWEGLDTHAGKNIQFLNNTIRNCAHGIAMVGAAGILTPIECKAIGNKIYGNKRGAGVSVVGAPTSYAIGNEVSSNYIENCGKDGGWQGGITFYETLGTIVNSNTVNKCLRVGIVPLRRNKGFSVTGNTIFDVHSAPSDSVADGIRIHEESNVGVIQGNNFVIDDTTITTTVMSRAIRANTLVNSRLTIGANNYGTVGIPLSGVAGNEVEYLTLGTNLKLFSSNGNPNGVITAALGSMCLNIAGGTGATFFIKETGINTNTGWVAK